MVKNGKSNRGPKKAKSVNFQHATRKQEFDRLTSPSYTPGLKYPDGNAQPSNSLIERSFFNVVTDANGYAAVQIAAGRINDLFRPATFPAYPAIMWGSWTNSANYTAIDGAAGLYRVVKTVIRAHNVASATNASGYVDILLTPGISYPTNVDDNAPFRASYDMLTLDITAMPPPQDGSSRNYRAVAATGDGALNDHGVYTLIVQGAVASTTVVRVEIIQYLETLPKFNTTLAQSATPAARRDGPLLSSVADYFASAVPVFTTGAMTAGAIASTINQYGRSTVQYTPYGV